ncbi:Kinase interacting-like family protein [Prunus dulcis]|uniref:Kinase interacting-like family protein n=1 Tax=Prunus dulcis TaxID=3755 RepID=A0A4Y1QVJ2_PRUDU|nr:Kinase interacting-like family protein [Prunus dulcis]
MHIHGGGPATSGQSSQNGWNRTFKMEEKVHSTLKIIDNDGDSFAQRAEMYYRKRPELVAYVEESFRAYRALAERYDHLSRDLQSANRTIATVFPERVQYAMEDEDEEIASQASTSSDGPNKASTEESKQNIPKVPKLPNKDFRSKSMLKRGPLKRNTGCFKATITPRSGLTKDEALEEIDKLQKDILALQTEKEFVKILYERGYDRYWEFENEITGMQKRVCSLQDEYGIGTVIEDNEARTLMAATALKSCKDSLTKLQEKKDETEEEARVEHLRVREASMKFEDLKDEFRLKDADWCDPTEEDEAENIDLETRNVDQERHDQELLRSKILEQLDTSSNTSTITELAEKIDGLVNKVVSLETAVSSQNALVNRFKSETDELQAHIRSLEEEKEILMENSDRMRKRIKELEEELRRIKNLKRSVEDQNNNLQAHFTEASCNLDHLSGKLHSVKHEEEDENAGLFQEVRALDAKPEKEIKVDSDKSATDEESVVLEDKMTEDEIKKVDVTILKNSVKGEEEKPI